jgi:hypothetical protein
MRIQHIFAALLFCSVSSITPMAKAQPKATTSDIESLKASMAKLEQMLAQQSKKLQALEAEQQLTLKQKTQLSGKTTAGIALPFNPEIGVVGDLVATATQSREDEEGNDRLSVRELELVLGADVDPYTRFDATIAFSDFEDVHLEEAYATLFGLPADFKLRLGRLRPKVGRTSPRHRDSLATVDEPLVIQRYFGVEGLSRTAVEISNFVPTPWDNIAHELIFGVMEGGIGEDGTLFGATSRQLSAYARLRNSWEISDTTDFELAGTYLLGSSDEDSSREVQGFGLDAVFNHHFNATNRLRLEAEALFQKRDEAALAETGHAHEDEEIHDDEAAPEDEHETSFRRSPWGMYLLADYRLAQRWSTGVRWDYVQPVNFEDTFSRTADVGGSVYLTFHQSEFARWRVQYERINFAEEGHDNRFFLQGTFAIGTHKHSLE